jgi:blocked early in transport 1
MDQHNSNSILESQNNALISQLSERVGLLKQLSIDIRDEAKSQNQFLDGMDTDFSSAQSALKGTMKKLGSMIQTGGGSQTCFLIGFIFFIFLLVWWLVK